MRKLTKKETNDAPAWAVSYSILVNSVGNDYPTYHERHYGYTLPLLQLVPRKEFDISEYEFSYSSVEIELNDDGDLSMWVSDDGLTSESCGFNKLDVIAMAKAVKLTAEDLK